MRRPLLLSISSVGLLVCLVGSTGLFAALQDNARTGTNSASSGGLAGSADIQIALVDTTSPTGCGTFSEDLTIGLFAISDMDIGTTANRQICVRNVGSQPVSVLGFTEDVVDVDDQCTGDEAAVGDTTCGNGDVGELSANLDLFFEEFVCGTSTFTGFSTSAGLAASVTAPASLPGLSVGETTCVTIFVQYRSVAATEWQQAQSDSVTWIFRFFASV